MHCASLRAAAVRAYRPANALAASDLLASVVAAWTSRLLSSSRMSIMPADGLASNSRARITKAWLMRNRLPSSASDRSNTELVVNGGKILWQHCGSAAALLRCRTSRHSPHRGLTWSSPFARAWQHPAQYCGRVISVQAIVDSVVARNHDRNHRPAEITRSRFFGQPHEPPSRAENRRSRAISSQTGIAVPPHHARAGVWLPALSRQAEDAAGNAGRHCQGSAVPPCQGSILTRRRCRSQSLACRVRRAATTARVRRPPLRSELASPASPVR